MKRGGPLRRGKPLKPGKPLERKSSLQGGSELKRGKPLAQRSEKRQKHMAEERRPLVEELIANDVGCEICPILDEAGIEHPPCRGIQGIHERRKSGAGGSRVNRRNLMGACNASNDLIEDLAGPVRELTGDLLVVREGDPEWLTLGARNDRL